MLFAKLFALACDAIPTHTKHFQTMLFAKLFALACDVVSLALLHRQGEFSANFYHPPHSITIVSRSQKVAFHVSLALQHYNN